MGEYQAILAIGPALNYTKSRFWPPHPGRIFRLFIIAFFIGAWMTGPFPSDISFTDIPYFSSLTTEGGMTDETSHISMVITAILLILLIYSLFSSIFQFIFVDYLSTGTEKLLSSFRKRIGMGIRLLGFYLAIILIIGFCGAIAILFIAIPVLIANPDNPVQFLVALVYTLTGLLIMIIPAWILTIITNDFIVPVMIVHKCGIIGGWKIIIREFSGRWDETGVYLLIKIIINIVTGVVIGFLIVGILEIFGFSSLVLIPGLQPAGSLTSTEFIFPVVVMGGITLIVMTPVVTFLRYYALIFLQNLSETYSLLPEVFSDRN